MMGPPMGSMAPPMTSVVMGPPGPMPGNQFGSMGPGGMPPFTGSMGPGSPMGGPPFGSMGPGGPPPAGMASVVVGPPVFVPGPNPAPGPVLSSIAPGGQAPIAMEGQFMPGIARPQMVSVANPPVVAGNIQYGPSYKMQYQKRSAADKSAVKYTGFLPLEGVYEEDTCRIG